MRDDFARLQPETNPDPRWRQKLAEAGDAARPAGPARRTRASKERDLLEDW